MTARPDVHGLRDRMGSALERRRARDVAGDGTFWALRDVSLELPRGRILGVIGRNGSGKTTLLSILARVTAPTEGRAEVHGRVAALLQVGAGFHPQLTGRDNIALSGAIMGMSADEVAKRFDDIVAFSEVGAFIDEPVKHYSSGMYSRLAFSVAAYLPSEVILVDEILSVGDAAFQRKSEAHMREVLKDGRSVIYVGHNLELLTALCDQAMVLEEGQVAFAGGPKEAVDFYSEEIVGQ